MCCPSQRHTALGLRGNGAGAAARPAVDRIEFPPSVALPSPRSVERASCPVCCGPSWRNRLASPDLLLSVPGLFRYVECTRCGTVYQSPRVRDEDLLLCYPTDFYTHGGGGSWCPTPAPPGSLRDQLRRAIRRAADGVGDDTLSPLIRAAGSLLAVSPDMRRRARLGLVDALVLPRGGHGRCLEVGPGQGIEMYCLRELGWEPYGLEIDTVAAERARLTSGCEVRVGHLTSTDYTDGFFDLVYMGHVFEHLPDPVAALRRCLELLKPGGRLVLLYPNPGALTARWYGESSLVWDPPRHLVLPPLTAVRELLARLGFAGARGGTLAWSAAVNAGAARRRRRRDTWDPLKLQPPRLLERAFAVAESLLVALGWPVGEEILVDARKPETPR